MPDTVKCQHCHKTERLSWGELDEKLTRLARCFNCNFWLEYSESDRDNLTAVVTHNSRHYVIGREDAGMWGRGYDGRPWTVRFLDGRVVQTTNLWHQGQIPERFRHLFQINAELTAEP